jgi:hypothetical protein
MDNDPNNGAKKPDDNHDKHKKLYHWVYVAGYIIVTAPIEFVFLWPETHLGAFLGFAALMSLPAIFEMTAWGYRPITTSGAVAGLFVLSGVGFWIIGPIPPPEPWRGWLQPANDPTPENGCNRIHAERPANAVMLIAGNDGHFIFGKQRVVSVGSCDNLILENTSNGLDVTASLFDEKGNALGTIDHNGYTISKENPLIVERSGDLSALVVHAQNGNEILYVRSINKTAVEIRGAFYCPNTTASVIINNNLVTVSGSAGGGRIRTHGNGCVLGPAGVTFCADCKISTSPP